MAGTTKKTLLWGGIYLLTLLSVITPVGLFTLHMLLVPLIVLMVLSNKGAFAAIYAGTLVIPIAVLGQAGLFLALLSLFYLLPAAAMARQYRKEAGPGSAIISGIIVWIGMILLALVVSFAFRFNLSDFMTDAIESNEMLKPMMESLLGTQGNIEKAIDLFIDMIPTAIISFAVYTTVLAHWLSRMLLSRYWKPVPKLKPMKDWRLPRSIIWYYLLLLILELFFAPEIGSTLSVVLINAVPLLTYALALQGAGFLFFVADAKGWNRALPVIGVILLPFIPWIMAWIGVIDMAFPLRSRMKPKE